ncbi:hypothetical protein M5D96_006018 [Drosophila gunungcola]|uniref:Uncharacterized protein n=1 Tax=Drosophila gunungcola TaxID=103775 RepID=A0A9Q0BS34_9MUSC|nr:hypothetical protein M5D96_006018 [Drosophila gunungcola]
MVRPMYLALATLLVLACSVKAAPLAESEIDTSPELSVSKQTEEQLEVHNSSNDSSEEADEDEEKDDDDDDDDIRRRREADTTEEPAEETATEAPTEEQKVDATTGAAPTRKPVLVLIRDALKKVTTDLPTAQVANNALQYFQQFEHFIQQAIRGVESASEDNKKPEVESTEKVPEVEVPAEVPEKETQAMEPVKMEESTTSNAV